MHQIAWVDLECVGGSVSEDISPDLLAELESLSAPAPSAHYLHLEDGQIGLDLPIELAAFLSHAATVLSHVLSTASPAPVYGDELLASDRIGDLVELDAMLRSQIAMDFAALVRLFSATGAPPGDFSSLIRATNRLRLAFSGKHDEAATAGKILCSVLLSDLLELRPFL